MASAGIIRLLIATEHTAFRYALGRILKEYPTVEIVGEVTDGEDAVLQAERLQPTVVLMDINLPKVDGIAATRRIKAKWPRILVVGISAFTDAFLLSLMRKAGAVEVVRKEKATDLYGAIKRAVATSDRTPSN
jgi:DNA-binding NarL/FixJ family response regulator